MKHPLVGGLAALVVACLMLWVTLDIIRSGRVHGGRGRCG